MGNAINWFEIPAANFDRAVKFYSTVFNCDMPTQDVDDGKIAFFPAEGQGVGGCVKYGGNQPSDTGTLAYLNTGNTLDEHLDRVKAAGGEIVLPKTKVSDEIGYIAYILDSEGNRVAFHSPMA